METKVLSLTLRDLLLRFITEKELDKIDILDLSPDFILECCRETPGIENASYDKEVETFSVSGKKGTLEFKIRAS